MENQMNVGDQNTQQIGQNPLNQPVMTPEKPKTNYLLIGGVVLICFVVFGFGGYYLGKQYSNPQVPTTNDQSQIIPTSIPTASSPTPINPTPNSTSVTIPGWKDYLISSINAAFQYPPKLEVVTDINNSTVLAADQEYWVAVGGSDILYLDAFLYKSNKTPTDWWNTEGKTKFEKLSVEIENVMTPKASVNLTYSTKSTTFAGKQALEVVVSSDYESPHTPKQRYLTILQQNGYIVMLSYNDQGTTASSIDISKQILSTFRFTN